MPQISLDDDYANVIVIFKTNPEERNALLEQAIINSQNVMEKKEGFVSTTLHQSSDGAKMLNISQWKNRSSYEKTISFLSPDEVAIGEKLMDMGASDWNTYRLVFCSGNKTTQILKDKDYVTILKHFTVNPKAQQELIDTLQDFSSIVEKNSDFIFAGVYKSFDGTRVCSYMQWKTKEAFLQSNSSSEAKPYFEKIEKLSSLVWDFFDVVYTS